MARPNTKKQIFTFIIGSILNLLLFCLTKYTSFPFWMDYTGTLYISVFGGPFAAIISLVVHTALLWILIDGWSALLPAIPILLIIILIYTLYTKAKIHGPSTAFYCTILGFITNAVIFLFCKSPLGRYLLYSEIFSSAINTGGKLFGALTLSGVMTIEILLTFTLLSIAWALTPKRGDNLIFKK